MTLTDDYETDQQRRGLLGRSTRRRRASIHELELFLDGTPVLDATHNDINRWLDAKHVCARTRSWHLSNLAPFYAWAVREDLCDRNPVDKIARPKLRRLLPRPIGDEQLRGALELASPRMRCWLMLACYQGFRSAEIARARREDVLDLHHPPLLAVMGKGEEPDVLPLNADVLAALQDFGMPKSGSLWGKREMHPNTVSRTTAAFLVEAGADATLHQLRHWFASTLYQQTRDLRATQEMMRHRSPQSTSIYTKYAESCTAEIVRGLSVGAPVSERR